MTYDGTVTPPGTITYVLPGESAATIQSKLNSIQPGNSLVFVGNATYDFGGASIVGKSGVTVWADGQVTIKNGPGAGTHGAFDFSGQSDWTIGGKAPGQGFVFNRSLIDATNAHDNWAVGNCQFNNAQSNGFDGSAIRMNGASSGTIINNDFTGVGGNVLGMYNLSKITIDGNHFVNCFEPISIQEPTTADKSLGHDIIIQRNSFVGTQRAAIEVGPASTGSEYFSGLVINNNYFDNFNNTAEAGTMLAISVVGQSAQNTTITNNFIRRGPADAGDIGVAIEMTGSGVVTGNTIANFSYAALTYQSGWDVHGNTVYNDGTSPYFGFSNNGFGTGTFGGETVLVGSPTTPSVPDRVVWGGIIPATGPHPVVSEGLARDTGVSTSDKITSSATLKGTADPNAVVHFSVDGVSIGATATANASGAWSFSPTSLADGKHTIVASETNAGGLTGSSSLTFTLDTKTVVPVVTAAQFATGHVTLTGTSEAGSAVSVYEGSSLVGSATAGSTGKWTVTGTGDAKVPHWYGAVATDLAGNVGQSTSDYSPTATAPGVKATLLRDTGVSATDKITSSPALTGTADPNALIHFTVDGASIAPTATANASGAWSFSPTSLADGKHTIVASETNASGLTGSSSLSFTLDTKAPVPAVTGATFANGNVTLTGTVEPGSSVSVYEGPSLIGSATSGTDGKWIVVGTGYASDPHWYGAVATDLAGNVGQSTSDYTWEACLRLTGGSGNDVLVGGAGNDRLNGRAGADVMMGGTGNDLSYVDNAGDKVIEAVGGGSDTVYSTVSWSMASSQEVEYLRAYGAGATSGVTLAGNELKNYLIGGSGNDVLSGGAGGDILWGRGGANTFVYRAASESTSASPDNITDFHHGIDKIDFTNIAGIAASGGVPQFQGNLGSTGNVTLNARSVAYMEVGNNTLVLVNSSAAAETVSATDTHTADMKIVLTGVHLSLTASDLHHS